jgi:hypothetical protein
VYILLSLKPLALHAQEREIIHRQIKILPINDR